MQNGYDLVIVGMGSAGMTAAEFGAGLGLRVAVVERARVGGDCLWTGCVPSKALLASAKAADTIRNAEHYGLPSISIDIDTGAVWDRLRRIQDDIASTDDDPACYAAMGVEIVRGAAQLVGPNEVVVDGDRRLRSRFILLCTGSRPLVPPIHGLADAGYLTSESIFELERAPRSIVFIGGGPIAIEMAQALRRLDVRVTVLQRGDRILPCDEPALVERLQARLRSEGVEICLGVDIAACDAFGRREGGPRYVSRVGADLGRARPVRRGRSRTECGRPRPRRPRHRCGRAVSPSTSACVHRCRRCTPPAMLPDVTCSPTPPDTSRSAWCATCSFRARAGPTPWFRGARSRIPSSHTPDIRPRRQRSSSGQRHVRGWRQDLIHSDRARADGTTEGAITIVTAKSRVVGAHILAPAAGELIHELALAIRERCSISSLGALVHVYPTLATGVQQLGGEAAFQKAERFRWLVRRPRR